MRDLQLERIIEAVTAGYQEYDLQPLFRSPLRDEETVAYRQSVCRDLETGMVPEAVEVFCVAMREVRATLALAGGLHYRYQKMAVFLAAVEQYLGAVSSLAAGLGRAEPRSSGFRAVRDYLDRYLASKSVRMLQEETLRLRKLLTGIAYTVHVSGGHITVGRKDIDPDYTAEVEATFFF